MKQVNFFKQHKIKICNKRVNGAVGVFNSRCMTLKTRIDSAEYFSNLNKNLLNKLLSKQAKIEDDEQRREIISAIFRCNGSIVNHENRISDLRDEIKIISIEVEQELEKYNSAIKNNNQLEACLIAKDKTLSFINDNIKKLDTLINQTTNLQEKIGTTFLLLKEVESRLKEIIDLEKAKKDTLNNTQKANKSPSNNNSQNNNVDIATSCCIAHSIAHNSSMHSDDSYDLDSGFDFD